MKGKYNGVILNDGFQRRDKQESVLSGALDEFEKPFSESMNTISKFMVQHDCSRASRIRVESHGCRVFGAVLSCFEANEQGLQKESTRADVAPATAHQCSCQWPRLLSGQQLVSKDLMILVMSVVSKMIIVRNVK